MPSHPPSSMRLSSGGYEVLVTCPTGASHQDKGQPCQDACMVMQRYYRGVPYTVLAIADGHGNTKYPRSDIGAHLAVEAAGAAASDWVILLTSLRAEHPQDWHKQVEHEVTHRLGRDLVRYWRDFVDEHAKNNREHGVTPESEVWFERYGSTLALTILYDDQFLIAANLGDGAIYLADQQDGVLKVRPVTESPLENVGLGTDSLVSPQAHYRWRSEVVDLSPHPELPDDSSVTVTPTPLVMVLLTTDGLTDSLDNPQTSVEQVCHHTWHHGMDWLHTVLPKQLADWSDHGVGDDMGCIVLFNTKARPIPPSEHVQSDPQAATHAPPIGTDQSATPAAMTSPDTSDAADTSPIEPLPESAAPDHTPLDPGAIHEQNH